MQYFIFSATKHQGPKEENCALERERERDRTEVAEILIWENQDVGKG
jgi:hypothetical protein